MVILTLVLLIRKHDDADRRAVGASSSEPNENAKNGLRGP